MPFQAAYYNMSDFRVIWVFSLFLFVHQLQFKFKNFLSSCGPPLSHGLEICQCVLQLVCHPLLPVLLYRHTTRCSRVGRQKLHNSLWKGAVPSLPYSVLPLCPPGYRHHLTVMALRLNGATEQLDPMNSMPGKVQQNMF